MALEIAKAGQTPSPEPDMSSPSNNFAILSFNNSISEVSVPTLLNPKSSIFVGVFFFILPELFLHEPCPNGHPRICDFVGGDETDLSATEDLPELDPTPELELLRLESVVDSVTESIKPMIRLLVSPNLFDPSNPIQLLSSIFANKKK
jgi:hypothetical protein